MKRIEKYLTVVIFKAVLMVFTLLVGLQAFISLLGELSHLGKGNYHLLTAVCYVLLQLPTTFYQFLPVGCLLGILMGLSVLATHNELVILRTAGLSILQIFMAILKSFLVLIVLMVILAETVSPWLLQQANRLKSTAFTGELTPKATKAFWLKEGQSLIRIGKRVSDKELRDMTEYRFDEQFKLITVLTAKHAVFLQGEWHLQQVQTIQLSTNELKKTHYSEMIWPVKVNQLSLQAMFEQPEHMSLWSLWQVIKTSRAKQIAMPYHELNFWKRLFLPLSAVVMMLLAIPVIFGPLRTTTISQRLLLGTSIGFGFYMLDRFFGPLSLVYHLPPLVAGLAPSGCFLLIGLLALRWAK